MGFYSLYVEVRSLTAKEEFGSQPNTKSQCANMQMFVGSLGHAVSIEGKLQAELQNLSDTVTASQSLCI